MLVHWLSFFKHHCPQCIDSSFNHLSLPPADLNTACFPSQDPLYCPQMVNFSRSVEKSWCHFMSNISQTHSMFFIVRQSFLFWNQISYFNAHVYSNLIVEMKSERCQFWKVFLEIKLVWSKIQHTLFNVVLWLPCILNTEMTRCKIKMTFSWFFVSVLIFDLGYIFWWSMMRWPSVNFKKQKGSSQNLRIHQERLFSFLSFYFISMHNNQ
jgi:hypothetical protein